MIEHLHTIYELTGLAQIESAWLAPFVASIYVAVIFFLAAVMSVRVKRMTHLSRAAGVILVLALTTIAAAAVIVLFPLSMTQGVKEGLGSDWGFLTYVIALFGLACLAPVYVVFRGHKSADAI